jgi:transaldolase
MNALEELRSAGQSIWLDFLRREMITSGYLDRLRREAAVTGITSNPSIFNKAIGHGSDYDDAIHGLTAAGQVKPTDIYYDLALEDVRMSSDVLRPVYEETAGRDGFVSFELDPALAHDTSGSIASAVALVARIGRPNIMIKVPGTDAGVVAVQQLTAMGVNVNITLLFSVQMYEKVALAFIAGLEDRLQAGKPIAQMASVASFFVSRVDTVVDRQLPAGSASRGKVAIANSKLAYQRFRAIFSGERWQRLTLSGAAPQRVLWASTGTKNPAYSDVLYVEELVGPETVNTMPEKTLDAFRDHGRVRPLAVTEGVVEASATIGGLAAQGISLDAVTDQLLEDGLKTFTSDLAELLRVIEQKLLAVRAGRS